MGVPLPPPQGYSTLHKGSQQLTSQKALVETFFVTLQGGSKVVCGGGVGTLNIFSWGEWGDISDRFPGHPMSIDACVPISDSVVCTGSIDGLVR